MKKLIQKTLNRLGYQISKVRDTEPTNLGLNNQINREVWLEQTLKKLPDGKKLLDAGAGELKYKKFCKHLNYISQDFAQYNGQGDSKGLQTQSWDNSKLDIVSDITAIPEPDNSFDAIMCIEVFEHLPEPIKAIKEFSRLLKKNGTLIVTAPFCSLTHFAPYHFYSGFNRYFYEKHLTEHGFEIEVIAPNGNYFEYLAQEIQLRVPNNYTNYLLSAEDNEIKTQFLNLLARINKQSEKSEEILCFGYNVKAIKNT